MVQLVEGIHLIPRPGDASASCSDNTIGEVGANMKGLLPPDYNPSTNPMPAFDIHFDDAPAFYLNGQLGPTDPKVRALERNVGALTSLDPYMRDSSDHPMTVPLTDAMADPVELQALHMVNADPNRTPTFVDLAIPTSSSRRLRRAVRPRTRSRCA